jgi:hypothetical protein
MDVHGELVADLETRVRGSDILYPERSTAKRYVIDLTTTRKSR